MLAVTILALETDLVPIKLFTSNLACVWCLRHFPFQGYLDTIRIEISIYARFFDLNRVREFISRDHPTVAALIVGHLRCSNLGVIINLVARTNISCLRSSQDSGTSRNRLHVQRVGCEGLTFDLESDFHAFNVVGHVCLSRVDHNGFSLPNFCTVSRSTLQMLVLYNDFHEDLIFRFIATLDLPCSSSQILSHTLACYAQQRCRDEIESFHCRSLSYIFNNDKSPVFGLFISFIIRPVFLILNQIKLISLSH